MLQHFVKLSKKIITINIDIQDPIITNVFKPQNSNIFSNTLLKVLYSILNNTKHFDDYISFKERQLLEIKDIKFTIFQINTIIQDNEQNFCYENPEFYENDNLMALNNVKIYSTKDNTILESVFAEDISFLMFKSFFTFEKWMCLLEKLDHTIENIDWDEKTFRAQHTNPIIKLVYDLFDAKIDIQYKCFNDSIQITMPGHFISEFRPENDKIILTRQCPSNWTDNLQFLQFTTSMNNKLDEIAYNICKELMIDQKVNDFLLIDMSLKRAKNNRSFKYSCMQINQSNLTQKVVQHQSNTVFYSRCDLLIRNLQQKMNPQQYKKLDLMIKYNMPLFNKEIQFKELNNTQYQLNIYKKNQNLHLYLDQMINNQKSQILEDTKDRAKQNLYLNQIFPFKCPVVVFIEENYIEIISNSVSVDLFRKQIYVYYPIISNKISQFHQSFNFNDKQIDIIQDIFTEKIINNSIFNNNHLKLLLIEIINLIGFENQLDFEINQLIHFVKENLGNFLEGPNNIRTLKSLIEVLSHSLKSDLIEMIINNPLPFLQNVISSKILIVIFEQQKGSEIEQILKTNIKNNYYYLFTNNQCLNLQQFMFKEGYLHDLLKFFIENDDALNVDNFIEIFINESGFKRIRFVQKKYACILKQKLELITQQQIYDQDIEIQNKQFQNVNVIYEQLKC